MDSVFLFLKIGGLILLGLFGLVLLILLAILFVPVRYRADFRYEDQALFSVRASWCLSLVSFYFSYQNRELRKDLRIFHFIHLRKDSPEKKTPDAERAKPITERKAKKKLTWEQIRRIYQSLEELSDDDIVGAHWDAAKDAAFIRLKKILVQIFPRRAKGEITYGFSSPFYTGELLSALSAVRTDANKSFVLKPDFSRACLFGHGRITGKITVSVLLYHFLRFYGNRSVRFIRVWYKSRKSALLSMNEEASYGNQSN